MSNPRMPSRSACAVEITPFKGPKYLDCEGGAIGAVWLIDAV